MLLVFLTGRCISLSGMKIFNMLSVIKLLVEVSILQGYDVVPYPRKKETSPTPL